jgi:hypothetical protein
MCYNCHVGANAGGHPGDVSQATVNPNTFTWIYTTRGYQAGTNFCGQCHASAARIVTDFQASLHATAAGGPASCAACHGDAHAAASGTAACAACHAPSGVGVVGHPFFVDGTTTCTACHNPHTTVAMPAGGHDRHISNGYACTVCHAEVIGLVNFDLAGPASSIKLPLPTYDQVAKTCSNVACHSVPPGEFTYWFQGGDGEAALWVAPYGGGTVTPSWYSTEKKGCAGCHDLSYQGGWYVWHSGYHGGGNTCQLCHTDAVGTVTPTGPSPTAALSPATNCGPQKTTACATYHRDGAVQVTAKFKSSCFGCH